MVMMQMSEIFFHVVLTSKEVNANIEILLKG